MTGVLITRRSLDRGACTQGEHHVNMKTDIEGLCVNPENHQKLTEVQRDFTTDSRMSLSC